MSRDRVRENEKPQPIKFGSWVNNGGLRMDPVPSLKQQVQSSDLHGFCPACKRLTETEQDVNKTTSEGKSCLHRAIIKEDVDAVRLLLSAGASSNVVDDAGNTPLLLAVRSGKIELVQLLIEAGADVDYINPKSSKWRPRSPLHDAIDAGYDILKLLLEHGADPNKANSFGESVLYKTARADYNRSSMLRLLLKHGADMNNSGLDVLTYPLQELISYNRVDGVRVFLEHGYDLNNYKTNKTWCPSALHQAVLTGGQSTWGTSSVTDTLSLLIDHYRAKGSLDLECVDWRGHSPLFTCVPNRPEHMKVLLQAGADPNHADNLSTPLEFALFSDISFHQRCIQLLVEAGADLGSVLYRLKPLDSWSGDSPDEVNADESEILPYEEDDDDSFDSGRVNEINERDNRLIKKKAKCIVKYRVLYESKEPVEYPVHEMFGKLDKLRAYYESCKAEIDLLRSCPFHYSVTYYNVLTNEEFWRRVRSDNPYEAFDLENLNRRFPIYSIDLRARFLRAKSKHELWETAAKRLRCLIGIDLDSHHLIFSKILNCLCERDLRSLRLC